MNEKKEFTKILSAIAIILLLIVFGLLAILHFIYGLPLI